jgi:hypothetical protein
MMLTVIKLLESYAGQKGQGVRFVNRVRLSKEVLMERVCQTALWCKECTKRFDDLSETIFSGHHQPLKVWILCCISWG